MVAMGMVTTLQGIRWGQRVQGVQGPNERVIELPLAFEVMDLGTPGRVLDAGCACNQEMSTPVAELTHLTQSLESEPIHRGPDGRVQAHRTYVAGDLRELRTWPADWPDRHFDRVVCISTLEHVGMDNRHYGGPEEHDPDSVVKAVAELWRVCAGTLLITVPFHHQPCMAGKWRYFTPETLDQLYPAGMIEDADNLELYFYAKEVDGWAGPYDDARVSLPAPRPITQIVCVKLWR